MRYGLKEVREASEGRSEGVYHVEVNNAEDKTTIKGEKRIALTLSQVGTDGQLVCFDSLMMQGKGLGITKGKLKQLGIDLDKDDFDSQDLIGRRVHVACVFGKPNDKGNRYLEVDIRAKGSKCGYWTEADPPKPAGASDDLGSWDDDTPF